MKPLEDYSIGQRIVITFIIALAILFLLAFIGWISGGWDATDSDYYKVASAEDGFVPSKYDERLLALDKEAIDNSYREQIEHLIAVWFRDEAGQPARALNGARTARKRYIDMQAAVEKREKEMMELKRLKEGN